ncbi:MAG TPA: hypothetical protein PLF42_17530 [Anaerolineales bacterium]|nr:hypothetical protein [Anaerolineales bacterium]
MADYLFRGNLAKLDPDVFALTQLEAERQYRKLILIPSESTAPMAVRETLMSAFQNIYAEGYPDEDTRWMSEKELLDYETSLANYRRNGDPRYYKGVEYANVVEALARRRAAQAFAANGFTADQIYVNVQALSDLPTMPCIKPCSASATRSWDSTFCMAVTSRTVRPSTAAVNGSTPFITRWM